MNSDDMLLLELIGFIISLGFFISIYLTKGNNLAENNENDIYSNISYKILLLSNQNVDDYNAQLGS